MANWAEPQPNFPVTLARIPQTTARLCRLCHRPAVFTIERAGDPAPVCRFHWNAAIEHMARNGVERG